MTDVIYEVQIGGQDVSATLDPILIELTVFDGTDAEADTASITLADIEGQTLLSDERDPVSIKLGTRRDGIGLVFEGYVADVRSRGSRGAGRTLSIECSSVDPGGKAKEEGEKHWDDQPLGTILEEAMKMAGVPISVAPSFASIIRPFEAMDGESPLGFVRRMAEEVGATFKVMGPRAVFVERNAGLDVTGGSLPVFEAAWGVNLIDWDLTPIIPKAKYAGFRNRWFDFASNEWKEEEETLSSGEARQLVAALKPDSGLAKQSAVASRVGAERKGGRGSITVLGSYRPQADGKCRVSGTRPGIDGTYLIESVEHSLSRSKGYTTKLSLRKPQGDAGKDSRVPVPTTRPAT